MKTEDNMRASNNFKAKFKSAMKKTVPLSLVLLITFNTTFAAALIQYYFYNAQMAELIAYIENPNAASEEQTERLKADLLPEAGVVLPVKWGDLGAKLISIGVIDEEKFTQLFSGGPLSSKNNEYGAILAGDYDGNIVLTQENSRFVLNTLWALGLAQRSDALVAMVEEYPEVENLAAMGGWSLGKLDAMSYYGQYDLLDLSPEQQSLVTEIAENIFRPCCNNHSAFADCNHGMAMLGLVEMMVFEGYSEKEIYDTALAVNTIWFPDTYLTIAKFMENERELAWASVNSKEVLGRQFSSGSGYTAVLAQVNPVQNSGGGGGGGGGCGV